MKSPFTVKDFEIWNDTLTKPQLRELAEKCKQVANVKLEPLLFELEWLRAVIAEGEVVYGRDAMKDGIWVKQAGPTKYDRHKALLINKEPFEAPREQE